MSLYKDGQISEIYKLIGEDIKAEDIPARVLALYAILEQEKGNLRNAKNYFERAKKNNFNRERFERQFNPKQKDLLKKTISGLLELGSLD